MGEEGEEGGGEGVILLPVRGAELKLLPFCNQMCKNYCQLFILNRLQ